MFVTTAVVVFAFIGFVTVLHWACCWGSDKRADERFIASVEAKFEAREKALQARAAEVERYRVDAEAYVKSTTERMAQMEIQYAEEETAESEIEARLLH